MPHPLRSTVACIAAVLLSLVTGACATSSPSEARPPAAADSEETRESTDETANASSDREATGSEPSYTLLASNLPDGANPFEGVVTAGQPSKAQFRRVAETDIETVVNLRSEGEEGTWDEESFAEDLGLNYVHLPIRSPSDFDRQTVERFAEVLEKSEGYILVHCGSSNRVGAMFALRAYWLENKSAERAMQIGVRAGLTSLKSAVRQKFNE